MCLNKKNLHGVRSGVLGTTSSKDRQLVQLNQSSHLADAHLGVHIWLYEKGKVPQLALSDKVLSTNHSKI
jgi:hypothetical protein